jgi:LPXTG-motif cell wall-anchored protein
VRTIRALDEGTRGVKNQFTFVHVFYGQQRLFRMARTELGKNDEKGLTAAGPHAATGRKGGRSGVRTRARPDHTECGAPSLGRAPFVVAARAVLDSAPEGDTMDTTTLVIIVVVLLLLGGGGYGYSRRRR